DQGALRSARDRILPRSDAPDRKNRLAADARLVVEGPSARDGPSQGRHRVARLCAAESAGRGSEGRLLDVRVADGGKGEGHRREGLVRPGAEAAGCSAGSAAAGCSAAACDYESWWPG